MAHSLRRFSSFQSQEYLAQLRKRFISPPKLKTCYNDKLIQNLLKAIPYEQSADINADLKKFSEKLEGEYFYLHQECETNPPSLRKFDGWGRQIDEIVTCAAWKKMKQISCVEGLVSIPYENNSGVLSRLHQGLKLFLFNPFSGLYTCPLAMTDGAAFIIKKVGRNNEVQKAYHHLVSRDPSYFWTSGQWMTEKSGGSDVARSTETIATYDIDHACHRLYGYKWFTSATDADMAFTLGRCLDENSKPIPGGEGLSLYYLRTKVEQNENLPNKWNNLEVMNMKNKMGTRQLPTSELMLNGSKAIKICETGRGISSISGMLTITRIHNSISACSFMRHAFQMALNYSRTRECFGQPIIKKVLHVATLAKLDIESRASFYLLIEVMKLLGNLENDPFVQREDEVLLRLLCPLLKLYTAKQSLQVVQESMECIGGQSYIEDTGLPGLLRDTHVLPIWEGTTNILSLDTIRAIDQRNFNTEQNLPESLVIFMDRCRNKLDQCGGHNKFPGECDSILAALDTVVKKFIGNNISHIEVMQLHSRQIAMALTEIYIGTLLVEAACTNHSDSSDKMAVYYWFTKDLTNDLGVSLVRLKKIDWMAFFQ